jgi:hypothetical protein
MMIYKGKLKNLGEKPAPVNLHPPQNFAGSHLGWNLSLLGEKQVSSCLSYGMVPFYGLLS